MRTVHLTHLLVLLCVLAWGSVLRAGTKTWDGKHATDAIEVTVVYFVPADRTPLSDWRQRVDYFCRRIELFHEREFQGQSTLKTKVHAAPLISALTTDKLRRGDGDAIYFRTLEETDKRLKFAQDKPAAFPILLVLSDINWRPLDDFFRLKPQDDRFVFEGNYSRRGEHFPGAEAGGARAAYLAEERKGWGLVSADGWRVPYRGSDCVVYHEGCGHTVGLPHPKDGNGSVMSLGQYEGWLSESWVDQDQKERLGWKDEKFVLTPALELYTAFRALPQPTVPRPGEQVVLHLDWPKDAKVRSLRVRLQTSLDAPWVEVPQQWQGDAPEAATLGTFDRAAPISYRLDAQLKNGASTELWGYLQVRDERESPPMPYSLSPDLITQQVTKDGVTVSVPKDEVDLLAMADPKACWTDGEWSKEGSKLLSPKRYGARLELPYTPPEEYRLNVIFEPLDEPNGLLFGLRSGRSRFVTLFNYTPDAEAKSAIENVGGRNVDNETTFTGRLLLKDRTSQAIITVTKSGVHGTVDGRTILDWKGSPDELSLSDYWSTPNENALFLGAYDCRYRFHRLTLEPISGSGSVIKKAE